MFGKLEAATLRGRVVAVKEQMPLFSCTNCGKKVMESLIMQCSKCKTSKYCSKTCQISHWRDHKTICYAIEQAESYFENTYQPKTMFASHLRPEVHQKLVNLVGEKCLISCKVNSVKCKALWDTGAQVSMVSKDWLNRNMPDLKLQKVDEILGINLNLTAANGTNIPYAGFVEVSVSIAGNDKIRLDVPMLVTSQSIEAPILGYNVIEEFVKTSNHHFTVLADVLEGTLDLLDSEDTGKLVSLIEANSEDHTYLGTAKVTKKDILVPKGQSTKLSCRANYFYVAEKTV